LNRSKRDWCGHFEDEPRIEGLPSGEPMVELQKLMAAFARNAR
jgi:hypothetical protein